MYVEYVVYVEYVEYVDEARGIQQKWREYIISRFSLEFENVPF